VTPHCREFESAPLQVFVTVGTDCHPFERLVTWTDEWAARAGSRAEVVVQHGRSPAPVIAKAIDFLAHDAQKAEISSSDVVVCHGGPATIMECRRLGRFPIVVARQQQLGEHVDNHQMMFSRFLGDRGDVQLADDKDRLFTCLDQALADRATYLMGARSQLDPGEIGDPAATTFRLADIVDALLGVPASRPRPRRAAVVRR
jgi:UDP-N-acetylglucosamine transferase subunit ALG13